MKNSGKLANGAMWRNAATENAVKDDLADGERIEAIIFLLKTSGQFYQIQLFPA